MNLSLYLSTDVILFVLFGLGIGVHYGLDGWVGRTDNERSTFKDSPRLKNFRWALGGALLAVVADFKGLGIYGDKSHDIVAYVAALSIAAVATIMSTAFLMWFRTRRRMRKNPDLSLDPYYPAITDYLVYGYHFYQKKFVEAVQRENEHLIVEHTTFRAQFYASYAEQLSYAMAGVDALSDTLSREVVQHLILQILRNIKGIVVSYHRESAPKINVNIMVAYAGDELPHELKTKVKFSYGEDCHYSNYLAIVAYADPDGQEDFVLPVENIVDKTKAQRCSLPGAPLAFLKNDCEIVDDTAKIEYSKSLPTSLKNELVTYFKRKSFKSFGCVPIMGRNATQLGVLVVESDKTYVFGKDDESKSEMNKFLQPFALLLGRLIRILQQTQ
jgi:hypothetical protein